MAFVPSKGDEETLKHKPLFLDNGSLTDAEFNFIESSFKMLKNRKIVNNLPNFKVAFGIWGWHVSKGRTQETEHITVDLWKYNSPTTETIACVHILRNGFWEVYQPREETYTRGERDTHFWKEGEKLKENKGKEKDKPAPKPVAEKPKPMGNYDDEFPKL